MSTDVLIVPGGGIENGVINPASMLRVDAALALVDEGLAGRLIFSGGSSWALAGSESEADIMYYYALQKGMDPVIATTETESTDTISNLALSSRLVEPGESVGVVTQPWHMPRCSMISRYVFGGNVKGYLADQAGTTGIVSRLEQLSMLIAKATLLGVEVGDIDEILKRNERRVSAMEKISYLVRMRRHTTEST